MFLNANDTDSPFDKSLTKYLFNSEKATWMSDRLNKGFLFSID